jgi:hypothetical protein
MPVRRPADPRQYLIVDKSKLAGTGAHATRSAATGRKTLAF